MSNNMYQAPQGDVQNYVNNTENYDETPIYSSEGRFNRSNFIVYTGHTYIVIALLFLIGAFLFPGILDGDLDMQSPLSAIFIVVGVIGLIIVVILNIIFTIRRLHDINKSGWWVIGISIISNIPIFGIFIYLWVFLTPSKEPNQYGHPQKPNSKAIEIGTWIYGIIFVLLYLGIAAVELVELGIIG